MNNEYYTRLAQLESANNPYAKNPKSSAKGKYQFIDSTAKQYGITAPFGTPEYTQQEEQAIKQFTADNYNTLKQKLGREPSAGELYLAHQQGAAGAVKLIGSQSNAGQVVGQDAISLNDGNETQTGQDFANQWINKFEGGGGQNTMQGGEGSDTVGRTIQLPDGRSIALTGNETPEQLSALKDKLRTKYAQPQIEQAPIPQGNDAGAGKAFAYGIAGGQVPFGNRITSGIGAGLATAYDALGGKADLSFKDYYKQSLADTKATQEANPKATLAGNLLGVASTLPAAFSKAPQGTNILAQSGKGANYARELGAKVAGYSPFQGGGKLAGAGNIATRYAGRTALAAPITGAYFAGEADTGEMADKFKQGAGVGAVLSGAIPAGGVALGAVYKGGKNVLTPKISEAGASVAKLAQKYKIPLGLDDLTDSNFYKGMISEGKSIPFSNAASKIKEQTSAWTRAVSKSIGADTDKITPDVIASRFDELGDEFNNFFKGKTINLGKDFGLGLRQKDFINDVADNYAVDGQNIIKKYITQINKTIKQDGSVDGEALGLIRNRLSKIARNSGNGEISSAARELENFIIDSVADVSEEGAKEAFKKTKYQYKNLIAIEPLAQKSQISGEISPAQLLGRVKAVYKRSFSKGEAGELGDLANIGQYIKETVPNSGTAQRTMARNILTGNMGAAPIVGALNPFLGALQASAAVAGAGVNRGLQSRNMDPKVIAKALERYNKGNQSSITAQQLAKQLQNNSTAPMGNVLNQNVGVR